jgi:hypothetical protein
MKTLILLLALAAQAKDDLAARAAAVKPTAKELTWERIPWTFDLMDAQRMAKAENRPIFLWATGDDPLERC